MQHLFDTEFFKDFTSCHLFIHEKGLIHSEHAYITRDTITKREQEVSEFTDLFLSIKKSKNKSFGQSSLKASNFQIIGTCLAIDIPLRKHNLIFVISRNDFLPQSEEDISRFNQFSRILKSYFEYYLSSFFYQRKEMLINLTINEFKSMLDCPNAQTSDIATLLKNFEIDSHDHYHKDRIELLGDLLNTLKHELSNPLFGMQLTAELLSFEDLEDDQLQFITEISSSIKRSQKILNNFSQLYSKNISNEEVSLDNLLSEVITLTKSETREIKFNVINKSNKAFNSNSTWLAQIFFNLIINSSQAMKVAQTSSPEIVITIEELSNHLTITFKDNGPGIPGHLKDTIFDEFITTKENGTGLGLAITKNLVHKLNGNIYLQNCTNGCEFKIEFTL